MKMKLSRRLATACFVLLFALPNGCRQKSRQPSPQQPRLSLLNFENIHEGMTIDEVSEILGEPQAGIVERAANGSTNMTLVGIRVSELARWTEGSGDRKRQLEIGLHEGKVAAAIYRDGDLVEIKPEVAPGKFRLIAGRHSLTSANRMRVIAEFGSPESCLLYFGIAGSTDEIEGFEAMIPPKRIEFTISGELLDQPQGVGKSLEVSLERHNPKATFTRTFAIDNEHDLADVLAFAHQSDIHELGEPIMLGRITGQEEAKHKIVLQVVKKAAE